LKTDGTVKLDTDLDTSGAENGLDRMKGSMSSLGSGAVSLASTGFKVLSGAIAGVSGALIAGATAGVAYNSSIETYTTSFATMLGSTDQATELMGKLKAMGAATPFETTDLVDATQTLMSFGQNANQATDNLSMLGDISQGNAEKLSSITRAFGKMSSSCKVSLEDINIMIDAGFNPLQEIANSTGESMGSLYDRISKGTMSVDEITGAMKRSTSAGGMYFESMQKQSKTFSGQLSTLKDNATQLLGSLTEGLQKNLATTLMPQAVDAVSQLTDAFATSGTTGLIQAGMKILTDVITGVAQALPDIINMAVDVINQFITSIGDNQGALGTAGIGILTALIGGIVSILSNLAPLALDIVTNLLTYLNAQAPILSAGGADALSTFVNGVIGSFLTLAPLALSLIGSLAKGIGDALPTLIPMAYQMIINLAMWILDNIGVIIDAGINLLMGLAKGYMDALPVLIANVPIIIGKLVMALLENIPKLIGAGFELLINLGAGLINAIPDLIMLIPNICDSIADAFINTDWGAVGKAIIDGIGRGMADTVSVENLEKAALNMVDGVMDMCKWQLGIHSPSTAFRDQVGKFIPRGIGVGIDNEMPSLTDDVRANMSNLVDAMQIEASSTGTNLGIGSSVVSNIYSSTTESSSAPSSLMSKADIKQAFKEAVKESGLDRDFVLQIGYEEAARAINKGNEIIDTRYRK